MCSDVAGPSNSDSGDLFELSHRSNETDPESLALLAAILDLSVTTIPILPFGACYVIKVYLHGTRNAKTAGLFFFSLTHYNHVA